jgi:hypothetical protein
MNNLMNSLISEEKLNFKLQVFLTNQSLLDQNFDPMSGVQKVSNGLYPRRLSLFSFLTK